MSILKVSNLCKNYPAFTLDNVSFSLEPGKITGFIGRNGAGKTTTLKSIMNFVYPDSGAIRFFDMPLIGNEKAIKQRIGYVSGGVDYYTGRKIKTISSVTASFFSDWDNEAYRKYMARFSLDENKTPAQLSAGMRVKYSLVLALSHGADLLILDEPTSGLDPVSREELLDIFLQLCDEGKTILFSTHITTDLEKCADNIIYIRGGRIVAEKTLAEFTDDYRLVEFSDEPPAAELIGRKRVKNGYSALVSSTDAEKLGNCCRAATLDEIMIHLEKEENE